MSDHEPLDLETCECKPRDDGLCVDCRCWCHAVLADAITAHDAGGWETVEDYTAPYAGMLRHYDGPYADKCLAVRSLEAGDRVLVLRRKAVSR